MAPEKGEDEQRSGGLKAGTVRIAIDGTQRPRPPVLIQVHGGSSKQRVAWRCALRTDWLCQSCGHERDTPLY